MPERKVHTFRADPDVEEILGEFTKYYKSHHINVALREYRENHPNAGKEQP